MMIGKPGNQVVGNQRCRARGKWGLWASLSVQLPMEQCNSGTVQYCSSASMQWCNMQQCTLHRCTLHRSKGAQNFTLEAQCTIVLLLCETNWEHVHCAPFSHFSRLIWCLSPHILGDSHWQLYICSDTLLFLVLRSQPCLFVL